MSIVRHTYVGQVPNDIICLTNVETNTSLCLYNFLFFGFGIINHANICFTQINFFSYLEICKNVDPIHKKYAGNNARTNAYTEFEIFGFS